MRAVALPKDGSTLCRRKSKFLTKLKYKTTSNLLYHAVQKVVSDELAELQKII